jgi:hypothetical protein
MKKKRRSHMRGLVARLKSDEAFSFALACRLLDNIVENPVTGCWEWQRRVKSNGNGGEPYGVLCVRLPGVPHPVPFRVHVLAWILFRGPCNAGHVRAHECDNTLCCNPAHIEQKTQQHNVNDSMTRGRHSSFKNLKYFGTLGDRATRFDARAPGPDCPF